MPSANALRPASANVPMAALGLLGLQDVTTPGAERRRIAVRRGTKLLDRLDELRLGLLEDAVPLAVLRSLREESATALKLDGSDRLRGLLDAIDVRCAVELAKLEAANSAR